MNKIFLSLGLGLLALSSCKDINTFTLGHNQGAFVLNQGDTETSTISRYDYEQENVINSIYQSKNNGLKLGPGASSFAIHRSSDYAAGKGYIVFPDRGEVEMINMENYQIGATIDGLSHPNDIVLANETSAYVSCGNGVSDGANDNVVHKLDLEQHTVVKTFEMHNGPAKMITSGKYLYVAHSGGESKDGSSIIVIDMSNDAKIDTVAVGIQPIDMEVDLDRNIWVFCDGDAAGKNQSLYKINRTFSADTIKHESEMILDLGDKMANGQNALTVSQDGRFVYYVHGRTYFRSIYKTNEVDDEGNEIIVPDDEAIVGDYSDVPLVGIDTDKRTGKLNGLAADSNGSGKLIIFDVSSKRHVVRAEYSVGINPIFTTYHY